MTGEKLLGGSQYLTEQEVQLDLNRRLDGAISQIKNFLIDSQTNAFPDFALYGTVLEEIVLELNRSDLEDKYKIRVWEKILHDLAEKAWLDQKFGNLNRLPVYNRVIDFAHALTATINREWPSSQIGLEKIKNDPSYRWGLLMNAYANSVFATDIYHDQPIREIVIKLLSPYNNLMRKEPLKDKLKVL